MDEITIIPALLCDSEIWTTSSGHLKASWGISSKSIKFTEGWANRNYQLLPNNLPQSRGPSCTLSSIGQAKSFPWQHQTPENYFLFQALFRDEGREDFSRIEKIFQGSAQIFLGAEGGSATSPPIPGNLYPITAQIEKEHSRMVLGTLNLCTGNTQIPCLNVGLSTLSHKLLDQWK